MAATVLYTPEVLGLATSLAAWPWDDGLPLKGQARSRSCGSTLMLGLELDGTGRIVRVAIRPQACAVGQAAAAIFAGGAGGRGATEIHLAAGAIASWLAEGGAIPDWPGLAALATARDYPARHGAIMLAWRAAQDLLPAG
ncbi:MAG: iron-sulfur cluster assembly scaffold protein [Novosphingobium sp.]